jgi:hypothetical protein
VRVPASQMAWSDLGVSVGAGVWGGLLPIPGATTAAVFFLLFLIGPRLHGGMRAPAAPVQMRKRLRVRAVV